MLLGLTGQAPKLEAPAPPIYELCGRDVVDCQIDMFMSLGDIGESKERNHLSIRQILPTHFGGRAVADRIPVLRKRLSIKLLP